MKTLYFTKRAAAKIFSAAAMLSLVVGLVPTSAAAVFELPPPMPMMGCTNPLATNFMPGAIIDNGSCILPVLPVPGCMNETATNYNPLATVDNESCTFAPEPVHGCTHEGATNYNPLATVDNESCEFPPEEPVLGCTDSVALNFNEAATSGNADAENCTYAVAIPEEEATTYRIQGYVWHDDNSNQIWDGREDKEEGNDESPIAGWTLRITNGEDVRTTVTDENGYYFFDVPAGTWTLTEDSQSSRWTLTTQSSYIITVPAFKERDVSFLDKVIDVIIPTAYAAGPTIISGDFNFGNDYRSGGGSSSKKTPVAAVLGISDVATSSEPMLISEQVKVVPVGAPKAGAGGTAPLTFGFVSVAPVAFLRRLQIHG